MNREEIFNSLNNNEKKLINSFKPILKTNIKLESNSKHLDAPSQSNVERFAKIKNVQFKDARSHVNRFRNNHTDGFIIPKNPESLKKLKSNIVPSNKKADKNIRSGIGRDK